MRKASEAMPMQLAEDWAAPLKPREGRSMKEASRHKTVRIRNFKKSRQLIDEAMAAGQRGCDKQPNKRGAESI
jgi:hypothetical protein